MSDKMEVFYQQLEESKLAIRDSRRCVMELSPWDRHTKYTVCCPEVFREEAKHILQNETEFLDCDSGCIPEVFAGDILVVYNRSDAEEFRRLLSVASDTGLCSVGKKSQRCLRPAPDAFAVTRSALERVGGLDPIFEEPYVRLADLAARVIEAGLETVTEAGATASITKDGADADLFISKHSYALLQEHDLTEALLDEYFIQAREVLVIADRIPRCVERLYCRGGKIAVLSQDEASVKACEALMDADCLGRSLLIGTPMKVSNTM